MSDFEARIDTTIARFDGVNSSAVYLGGVTRLKNVSEQLNWHEEKCEALYMVVEHLTLDEIYKQCREKFGLSIVTVFVDDPLKGVIYQCNNYENGKWVKYGETIGYS